jgi:hypothetical protein
MIDAFSTHAEKVLRTAIAIQISKAERAILILGFSI